jgi:selenocysteine-specific elongation factor
MDADELGPSDEGFVQFVFSDPVIALPGDRFVIRGSGRIQTLGGGEILSIHPPRRKRGTTATLSVLRLLKNGTDRERVLFFVRDSGMRGISFLRLMEATNLPETTLERILKEALRTRDILQIDGTPPVFLHQDLIVDLSDRMESTLKSFHNSHPLERGIEKEVLRSQLAQEADKRDTGFADFTADLIMTLRNKQGEESLRDMRSKTLEVDSDGDKTLTIFDRPNLRGSSTKRIRRLPNLQKHRPYLTPVFLYCSNLNR